MSSENVERRPMFPRKWRGLLVRRSNYLPSGIRCAPLEYLAVSFFILFAACGVFGDFFIAAEDGFGPDEQKAARLTWKWRNLVAMGNIRRPDGICSDPCVWWMFRFSCLLGNCLVVCRLGTCRAGAKMEDTARH